MNDKDKEWEDYLLSIGVTNLNDEAEINRKLEEIELNKPSLLEALKEENGNFLLINSANKEYLREWLESLAN